MWLLPGSFPGFPELIKGPSSLGGLDFGVLLLSRAVRFEGRGHIPAACGLCLESGLFGAGIPWSSASSVYAGVKLVPATEAAGR